MIKSVTLKETPKQDVRLLGPSELPFPPLPVILDGIPQLREDEEEEEKDVGEANPHVVTVSLLLVCLRAHLGPSPAYRAFANMNLYYDPNDRSVYVSPDAMVVSPSVLPAEDLTSYRIGETGPAPVLTVEVLSQRSAQQQDLGEKLRVYALLGIPEYLVVDVMGIADHGPLVLKRLQADRTWRDERDPDGGVTSQLGFRVVLEPDGLLRVLETKTGRRYARPQEAQALADQLASEAKARRKVEKAARQAMERVRALEEELAHLKSKGRKRKGS